MYIVKYSLCTKNHVVIESHASEPHQPILQLGTLPSPSERQVQLLCEYKRLTSREWTFVLKLLNLTDSTLPLSIKCGSASPQVDGTATSPDSFVYASNVNVPVYQHVSMTPRHERFDLHSSCKIGRKVVVLVICFIISLISPWTSFSVFSFFFPPVSVLPTNVLRLPPAAAASSVWISNCQRSRVSFVSIDLIARTSRFIEAVRSHSDYQRAGRAYVDYK